MYRIETHAHTCEVSTCGKVPAREMVAAYKERGYDTLFITDHMYRYKWQELPPAERADAYLAGYRAAREEGKRLGIRVLLGVETSFGRHDGFGPEDMLVYGVTEEDIPELFRLLDTAPTLEAYHEAIRSHGWLLIQAHPFRKGLRPIPWHCLDGVEVYNAHPRHNSRNWLALRYALRGGFRMILTGGSDAHQMQDVARGGLLSPMPIESEAEFVRFLQENHWPERIETE